MRWLTFLTFILALLARVPAQDGTLALQAAFEPATAKPGDKVVLVLTANVTDGWHAYGSLEKTNIPVALLAENIKTGGLQLDGAAIIPPGVRKTQPLEQFPLPNTFTVKQPMKVPACIAPGEVTVSGAFDFQICNENMCLPPEQAPFTAKLKIEGGAPAGGPAAATGAPATGGVATDRDRTPKPGLRLEPDEKVAIAAKFEPATARAGEHATLVLTVTVRDERWHAYGALEQEQTPVTLDASRIDTGVLQVVGEPIVPPGEKTVKAGRATYPLPHVFDVKLVVFVPAGTKPGPVEVEGPLTYQICDANVCEPTTDIDWKATLVVEAGEPRDAARKPPQVPAKVTPVVEPESADDGPFGGSWWALILACIGGGLFALAMPCTYPMIPITFSFFTKQAEKRGGNVLSLALVYGFGIVAMFVLVGVGLSTVIIDIANHWVTNSVIGVVFLVFAFTLFGWIDLQPPRFLQDAAAKASGTGGYLGVFFMGAALVITSFTCTAPIVGSLIANVAKAGIDRVAVGMTVFGLTMAAPFVALSLMPTRVKAMPRSGEWMETLKVSLGFVELAATLKFVSMVDIALDWNALPRELFLLLIASIFLLWAMYLFGILRKAGTANDGVSGGRMATGMGVVLLATYMLFGGLGYKLDFYMTAFVPPYSAPLVGSRASAAADSGKPEIGSTTHTIVKDDGDRALEVAKAEDKLLLYNFTGFN